MSFQVKRAEVWKADLNPVRRSEQAGERPIVVVQTDRLNRVKAYTVVVVVPLTAEQIDKRRKYPTNVFVPQGEEELIQDSLALCGQVRTISKERLISKWGEVSATTIGKIEAALRWVLGR